MKKFWFWFTKRIFYSRILKEHRQRYCTDTLRIAGVELDYNLAEKFADFE